MIYLFKKNRVFEIGICGFYFKHFKQEYNKKKMNKLVKKGCLKWCLKVFEAV
jgi:hypothetical protein